MTLHWGKRWFSPPAPFFSIRKKWIGWNEIQHCVGIQGMGWTKPKPKLCGRTKIPVFPSGLQEIQAYRLQLSGRKQEYSSCAFIQKVKTKSWNYIFSLFGPKNWLPIQKLVYQYRWQPWLDYCTVPLLKLLLNSHRIPKCPQLTFGVNGTKRPLPDCLLMTFFGFVPNATKSKTFLWIKM